MQFTMLNVFTATFDKAAIRNGVNKTSFLNSFPTVTLSCFYFRLFVGYGRKMAAIQ